VSPGHSYVIMSFILALSVCFAVGLLLSWHVYLVVSAQTTIEWYGNRVKAQEAKKRGQVCMYVFMHVCVFVSAQTHIGGMGIGSKPRRQRREGRCACMYASMCLCKRAHKCRVKWYGIELEP
jgi:hypothetical protein